MLVNLTPDCLSILSSAGKSSIFGLLKLDSWSNVWTHILQGKMKQEWLILVKTKLRQVSQVPNAIMYNSEFIYVLWANTRQIEPKNLTFKGLKYC